MSNNKEYKRGDLVVVVDDTTKSHIGRIAEYIGYNDDFYYDARYPYIVNMIDGGQTAVLEIRPLSLLEIELQS